MQHDTSLDAIYTRSKTSTLVALRHNPCNTVLAIQRFPSDIKSFAISQWIQSKNATLGVWHFCSAAKMLGNARELAVHGGAHPRLL